MILLSQVLAAEDVARARETLAAAPFRHGRATASGAARRAKDNAQADGDDARVQALARFVRQALERHPVFAAYARPAQWSGVLFSRYGPGQGYGPHTDLPHMAAAGSGSLRTDLSFTLFLSDPADYAGGALRLDALDGERLLRPAAGDAVLYQTGQVHEVTPVEHGERLAAVGWIQSRVRSAEQREVLFDLERLRWTLRGGEARLQLDKTLGALVRMWAD